ncbi:hypothetical protein N7468_008878 [Penicillium chermesinum]|uniref:Uncharacterized protein n=1 Tax=Penicillium chermesinum TaxID=63820 RepID=A0A9W9NGR7_9EURO|nr:uncharacterized protein N7468_008878 [Penicillium chermesinum]KAJ5219674.1 hypothetical protein N7468_008878 [Penicillium chermesinum]KAJ6153675.1 hypothetical protein N7470_006634 [Penicillium chermesinum]
MPTFNLAKAAESDDSDADRTVIQIFTECLELETITENEAAKRIDEYHRPAETSDEEDEPNIWLIWGAFLRASFMIPHDHPAQDKLIQILLELQDLPSRRVEYGEFGEVEFWTELPVFRFYMIEVWSSVGPFNKYMGRERTEEETTEASREWRNFISFSARLWEAEVINCFNHSVYALRDTLEADEDDYGLELKWRVAAASEWIVHCGDMILEIIRDNDFVHARTPAKGSLYDGKGKTEMYRWEFWKRRFEEVSGQLEGDFKTLALDCADRMQKLSESLE